MLSYAIHQYVLLMDWLLKWKPAARIQPRKYITLWYNQMLEVGAWTTVVRKWRQDDSKVNADYLQ